MQGAILCFAKTRRIFSRIQVHTLCLPVGNAQVKLYILPHTEASFLDLSPRKKTKLLAHAAKQMGKDGIKCIYPVQHLRKYVQGNFYIPTGRRIFYAFAGQIIKRHFAAFSLAAETTNVCIYENPFTNAGKAAAELMAMYTKQMTLISPNTAGLQSAAKQIFENFGLAVQISTNEKLLNKADIALLLTSPGNTVLTNGLILDYSGTYPHRARRDLYFETALGYAPFLHFFDKPNCQSAEFLLLCSNLENASDLPGALASIGWYEKA